VIKFFPIVWDSVTTTQCSVVKHAKFIWPFFEYNIFVYRHLIQNNFEADMTREKRIEKLCLPHSAAILNKVKVPSRIWVIRSWTVLANLIIHAVGMIVWADSYSAVSLWCPWIYGENRPFQCSKDI